MHFAVFVPPTNFFSTCTACCLCICRSSPSRLWRPPLHQKNSQNRTLRINSFEVNTSREPLLGIYNKIYKNFGNIQQDIQKFPDTEAMSGRCLLIHITEMLTGQARSDLHAVQPLKLLSASTALRGSRLSSSKDACSAALALQANCLHHKMCTYL